MASMLVVAPAMFSFENMQFGSIPANYFKVADVETMVPAPTTLPVMQITTEVVVPTLRVAPTFRAHHKAVVSYGATLVSSYDEQTNSCFAALDAKAAAYVPQAHYTRAELKRTMRVSNREISEFLHKQRVTKLKEEKIHAFDGIGYVYISGRTFDKNGNMQPSAHSIGGGPLPSLLKGERFATPGTALKVRSPYERAQKQGLGLRSPFYRRTPRMQRREIVDNSCVRGNVRMITDKTLEIAKENNLPIEFIGKRHHTLRAKYVRVRDQVVAKVSLPHEKGVFLEQELSYPKYINELNILYKHSRCRKLTTIDLTPGSSGFCFDKNHPITKECTTYPFMVVRGRRFGELVNALSVENWIGEIHHYTSNVEMQFMQGWPRYQQLMKPKESKHTCAFDFNNQQCGEYAAAICQSTFPLRQIACKQCRNELGQMSKDEFKEYLDRHLDFCKQFNIEELQGGDLVTLCEFLRQATTSVTNFKTCAEISRLVQGYTSTHMLQIQDINKALLKGSLVTQAELDQACKQLLEMTQWWKKHMNLTGEDALRTFRNKRASKALINPTLMCDNQLDKNGNFVWGERGYHSKRFFTNFFEKVDPSNGYGEYIFRKGPNGVRELAIGSLIVPLNIERARIALKGKSIEKKSLTQACTSRQDGNFVYACCCVTHEDGTPLYSELKSPTKRHLVVGTSGEPKFIDLPTADTEPMYIAREGYCYLNIFLAMLVNVNEGDAKEFTKMVRDVLIPLLGTWPKLTDLATAVYILTVFHPETRSAELPRILVDHEHQTMHVIDSFGSLSTGYHVLKTGTVSQLIHFGADDLVGEMKDYRVGGEKAMSTEMALIKSIFKPRAMLRILNEEPYLVLMGIISPAILVHMYRLQHLEKGIEIWIQRDQSIAKIFIILEQLTKKVAVSELLTQQLDIINGHVEQLQEVLGECPQDFHSHKEAKGMLDTFVERMSANKELVSNGYFDMNYQLYVEREKMFVQGLQQAWRELKLLEKFSLILQSKKFSPATASTSTQKAKGGKEESSRSLVSVYFTTGVSNLKSLKQSGWTKLEQLWFSCIRTLMGFVCRALRSCYRDFFYVFNLCLIFCVFVQMIGTVKSIMESIKADKALVCAAQMDKHERTLIHMYDIYKESSQETPLFEEFRKHVEMVRPDLVDVLSYMSANEEVVTTQAKTAAQLQLEKVVAFFAILTMCFDTERSDAVFKVLNKLRAVFLTLGEGVRVQSLDEILSMEGDKGLTVDFDLDVPESSTSTVLDVRFDSWWQSQLQRNFVVPHYRTSGTFMEFTRESAARLTNEIILSSASEFLIRGAVGSGKSTGLPHHLSKKGGVLLLEPTRPLAENVSTQLAKDPFYQNVTLRMRGLSKFGSSNISVMTTGYAFHYYANNPHQLTNFDFVIIDECHVHDANAIAFNCLLKNYSFSGKLLKVSATPPGRECEFATQHAVHLKTEDALSFQAFVQAQGTHANADVVQYGHNILVYVASYNEVDMLAKLLVDKHYRVTKVDGRSMQLGKVEITTQGTSAKPHFIVATNIIENGITIDIDCVVDFGIKVVATLDSDNRCMRYSKCAVTYGERIQRLGRVGRCKPGYALRIGHTEKGIEEVPESIATEAAFLCFAYSLPVTTNSVSTNILSRCTVKQAKNALNFELTPFFTVHFIRHDGSMHPEVHRLLKPYKLKESEMNLNKLAIPHQYTSQWITSAEYERLGVHIQCPPDTRAPFHANGIPDKLIEALWGVVCEFKNDAGFGTITSACAAKISYTLSTEPGAIPRTLAFIEHLLTEEMIKRNHFDTLGSAVTGYSFSLAGIANSFRKRYLRDYSAQNIATLQQAKAQLLEFDSRHIDYKNIQDLSDIGILNTVHLQSKEEVSKFLKLEGKWDGKSFMNDLLVGSITIFGGGWMLWEFFIKSWTESVTTQGKKRRTQKLHFRDAYDRKMGRMIVADDNTMEQTFGEAYTKRGKVKGSRHTKGMGRKTRNFVHIYGVEPDEYSFIRFVDPITGHTMDESPRVDIRIVQDEMQEIRTKMLENDEIDSQQFYRNPGISAYLVATNAEKALKIDLTPHMPTLLQRNTNAIAGFPEYEGELRQTGAPLVIDRASVPAANQVNLESKSVYKGLRDYNNIATIICRLENTSDGHNETMYGVGYGSYILTNGHLFRRNNGSLTIKTWHGDFKIANSTQIFVHFVAGKDLILLKMPKDFPPFCKMSIFRAPIREERVCMVGTNFQEKSLRATMSEASITLPEGRGSFWVHWISTKDGDCGLPMVATSDGYITGIHGLASNQTEKNFFVPFTDALEKDLLINADELEWNKHWLWQPSKIAWGSLNLVANQPGPEFKVSKLITDLFLNGVQTQSKVEKWVYTALEGNLRACGEAESALITKHTVKGRCRFFSEYLATHAKAENFFRPLMGAYAPSKLNKDAFKRDFFKYNKPVELDKVQIGVFQQALKSVINLLEEKGFKECVYVTDTEEIFDSLNLKSAVGAQYRGKKGEYIENLDSLARDELLRQSCERLFLGKKGIWNGSLKAELRPMEKIRANKTRTFTAAPIDTLLGAKVCVDDFNNQFYSLNMECPWTVGMTKFYGGWDKLMRKLPENWVHCHADGSQFDSSLTPLLLNAVLTLRMHFMEEWFVGQEMLKNLYAEIVYTPILTPDGTICKKFRGNNSGQPSTVVDNTLMVVISVYYACHKLGWSALDVQNQLVFFANGDDIILSLPEEHVHVLDTFQSSFEELGLNYDFSERTRDRSDLWFMSHQGKLIDGMYIPKLEEERVVSILEWDRSKEILHRTEAICAAMIEAWGHPELLREIRLFYLWLLQKSEFRELAAMGKTPYIAETALQKLYTDVNATDLELQRYVEVLTYNEDDGCGEDVILQADDVVETAEQKAAREALKKEAEDKRIKEEKEKKEKEERERLAANQTVDAGGQNANKNKTVVTGGQTSNQSLTVPGQRDLDVNVGTKGRQVPRLQKMSSNMKLPMVRGQRILDLAHLIEYQPQQADLFNTRASQTQFNNWYDAIKNEYGVDDSQMQRIMNGFMVWCLENGTSPNVNGVWVMMDGDEQVEFPLKPMVENAKPTLRQIMHHFSDAAEAYIELRNAAAPYMPRYGLIRNLRDRGLARFAFDFYEVTSKTPDRAREAVAQMKAAALNNVSTRMFGLDGNIATATENTERHTAKDVSPSMHSLLGISALQ
uniref:Genome polyprotein n=1 Tax=Zantedeschia mild mosaic virus TaxID=270478 RepID=A0A0U4DJS8_9POTV|nr:polyprotein [Zantedeschia mild mosaic virus]